MIDQRRWRWLEERPHPWRKELWVKGRRLRASSVWIDSLVNAMTPLDASGQWDLPVEACREIFEYCEINTHIIESEAKEEWRRLRELLPDVNILRIINAPDESRDVYFCESPASLAAKISRKPRAKRSKQSVKRRG